MPSPIWRTPRAAERKLSFRHSRVVPCLFTRDRRQMTLRSRMLTTAVLLCHLLLLPKLVTSEARADGSAQEAAKQQQSAIISQQSASHPHIAGPNEPSEDVTI